MEGLRHTLFAPSTTTFMMVCGVAHAMSAMIKPRYKCKDENGKPLLPHPYEPWKVPDDPKSKEATDKAYRAFKMFENVKEWTFLTMPVMWVFAIYGGDLPYITENMMDGVILISGTVYAAATHMYASGYLEAPDKRITGFKLRRKVAEFWLFGAASALLWGGLMRIGVVKKDGWMNV